MGGDRGWNAREEEMNASDEHDEEHTSLASERHYSVTEIAKMWSLSERTVKRMFQDEPGVLKWGSEERLHKRGYWTLRVPRSVLERVHRRLRQPGD